MICILFLAWCLLRAEALHSLNLEKLIESPLAIDNKTHAARSLNLEICRTRLDLQHSHQFDLDFNALPKGSQVWLCESRKAPHAGILYITNFLNPGEVRDTVTEAKIFVKKPAMGGREARCEWNHMQRVALLALQDRIDAVIPNTNGLFNIGRDNHKDNINTLHHDFEYQKYSWMPSRAFTFLLYLEAPEQGGHTVFPFLSAPAGGWEEPQFLSDLVEPWGLRDLDPREPVEPGPAVDLTKEKCDELVADDALGRRSMHFAFRVSPGDAIIFWHKLPAPFVKASFENQTTHVFNAAIEHFHTGCPCMGEKLAVQKHSGETSNSALDEA